MITTTAVAAHATIGKVIVESGRPSLHFLPSPPRRVTCVLGGDLAERDLVEIGL